MLRIRIYLMQTLIDILANLIPYYFVRFKWYRRLIYQSMNIYHPIDLDLLYEDLNDYSGELNMYAYYEDTNL